MRQFHTSKVIIIAFIFILTGCTLDDTREVKSSDDPGSHEVIIKKENGTWKAVDSQPDTYGLVVSKNDTISWRIENSDATFQFPINYHKYLRFEADADSVTDGYRRTLTSEEIIRATVKKNAPRGDTLSYAVLVVKDCVLAEGDSVPILIISDN